MNEIDTIRGLLAEAIRLRDGNQVSEAAAAFAKIATQFDSSTNPAVRETVAEAILNLGVMFRISGDPESAIAIFDHLVGGNEGTPVSFICALFNKGGALMTLGRTTDAVATYEQMLQHADSRGGDDPTVLDCVSGGLLNLGVIHSRSGSIKKALAAFDEVVRRFAKHSSTRLQNSAAQAMHNKAMALRNAGRGPEAIAAFTEVVEQFSDAAAEELRHWAGLAQYNKSIHLARLGEVEASVRAAEEMVRRFGNSTDSDTHANVAKALYSRAMVLRAAGFAKESVEACWDIQARFKDDPNPVVQSVVAAARRYDRFLVALADPTFDAATGTTELDPTVRLALGESDADVGGVGANVAAVVNVIWDGENPAGTGPRPLRLPEVLQILQTSEQKIPRKDPKAEELAIRRKLLREQLRRDLEGHTRCGEILAAYLDRSEPFGLFLRNFDIEGYLKPGSGAPEPIRISVQFKDQGLIEKKVATTLGTKLPLISVGNNTPMRADFKQRVPRILLSNEHWQEVVEELIGAASTIIMDVVRLTPGVLWELEAVERLRKQDRTAIILSAPRPEEGAAEAAALFYGLKRPHYPMADPSFAEFRAFKRIVRESELPENLIDASCFIDLMSEVERLQRLKPEERPNWDGIEF